MEDRHYQILSESRKVGWEILKLFFNEFEWWRTTGREREREKERHRGSSQFGQYPDYRRLMRFLHDQTHIAIQSREYQPSALSIHNTRDTERTYWEIIFHYSDSEISGAIQTIRLIGILLDILRVPPWLQSDIPAVRDLFFYWTGETESSVNPKILGNPPTNPTTSRR